MMFNWSFHKEILILRNKNQMDSLFRNVLQTCSYDEMNRWEQKANEFVDSLAN